MTEPCNLAKNLSKSFADHFLEFTTMKVLVEKLNSEVTILEQKQEELRHLLDATIESEAELLNRVFALEEKDRQRAREDHDREVLLDEIELARIE